MNRSSSHYINVGNEGKPIKYVKVKGQRLPILIEPEEYRQQALDNVEMVMRYYQIYQGDNATWMANFIYSAIKADDRVLEIEEINERIMKSMSQLELIHAESREGLPVFCMKQQGWSEQDLVHQTQRNEALLSRLDSQTKEYYLAVVSRIEPKKVTKAPRDMESAAVWFALGNPWIFQFIEHNIVEKDLSDVTCLTRLYHENSKLHPFHQQGDFMKPLDEIDEEVKQLTTRGRKSFYGKKVIPMPEPTQMSEYSIEEVIARRRSLRHYTGQPVDLQTISNILHYSYGITGRLKNTGLHLRAVPSGGGLYPVDIYMAVNYVDGLNTGIYYYDPFVHRLTQVNDKDMSHTSKEISGYSSMLDQASVTFILSANFWRNQWKYHERGYRVILLDCGHVAQNIHLMCTAYNLASCCVMGFVDNEVDEMLELDGVLEHSMYLITAGQTKRGV